jgi:hypothetical protein
MSQQERRAVIKECVRLAEAERPRTPPEQCDPDRGEHYFRKDHFHWTDGQRCVCGGERWNCSRSPDARIGCLVKLPAAHASDVGLVDELVKMFDREQIAFVHDGSGQAWTGRWWTRGVR